MALSYFRSCLPVTTLLIVGIILGAIWQPAAEAATTTLAPTTTTLKNIFALGANSQLSELQIKGPLEDLKDLQSSLEKKGALTGLGTTTAPVKSPNKAFQEAAYVPKPKPAAMANENSQTEENSELPKQSNDPHTLGSKDLAKIIGAGVGGGVGLVAIIGAVVGIVLIRRRRRKDNQVNFVGVKSYGGTEHAE